MAKKRVEIIGVSWADGYRARINADIAFRELERIKKLEGGDIKVEVVHDKYAKNKTNPLHDALEWNNAKAGREHRLYQLRTMVRCIRIIHPKAPSPKPVPAFVNVTRHARKAQEPRRVYTDIESALTDPVYRAEVLTNALREAASFRKRYAALSELSTVFHAIDKILATA